MWWTPVPSGLGNFANMRQKLNAELEDLEEQWKNKELPWSRETLESLVEACPHNAESDAVLAAQEDLCWAL